MKPKPHKFFVYGLFDVDKPEVVRYIGAASNETRPLDHEKEARWHPECAAAIRVAHAKPEVKARLRAAAKANRADPKVREKFAVTMALPEFRERRRAIAREINDRPEVREKMDVAHREAWKDPEIREKRIAGMKAAWVRRRGQPKQKRNLTPEMRERRSSITKENNARPEVKAKQISGIKAAWDLPGARERRSAAMSAGAKARWARSKSIPGADNE
jgi:hypothetical protein